MERVAYEATNRSEHPEQPTITLPSQRVLLRLVALELDERVELLGDLRPGLGSIKVGFAPRKG